MNENNKETQMQEASESETYAVDFRGGLDDGVELYSSYGGAVSSLYVDYFRGFVLNFRLVVITFFIVIVNIVTLCILVWIFKKVVM